MVKAFRIEYTTSVLTPGKKEFGVPSTVIYLPEQGLFIEPNISNGLIHSSDISEMYVVFSGKEACTEFDRLLRPLNVKRYPQFAAARLANRKKFEQIEVPEAFVEWARAVYKAKNPPEEAHVILDR